MIFFKALQYYSDRAFLFSTIFPQILSISIFLQSELNKTVAITGATGLLGKAIAVNLSQNGYNLKIISRDAEKSHRVLPFADTHLEWNSSKGSNELAKSLEGTNSVINLAGASVGDKRWSLKYKDIILSSRIKTTDAIVKVISGLTNPPALINASAIGYYGNNGDTLLEESSGKGDGFLADVVDDWEKSANNAQMYTRVVKARIGIVLANDGGALQKMILPYKFFAGGPLGSGKQWMSWIHIDDLAEIFRFIIENDSIKGAVNLTAPNPVTMKDFSTILGKTLNRPSFFKVPDLLLKLILGESAQMVTFSQRVSSALIQNHGNKFKFSKFNEALKDILK